MPHLHSSRPPQTSRLHILFLPSIQSNLEHSAVATGLEKSVFIPIPKKAMPKNAQTTTQLHSSHTLEKSRSKFSKPGFNSMWTVNFQMFTLALEKAEEPDDQTSIGSLKKQESSRKHLFLLYWLCQSLWLCGSQKMVENSERDGNTRPPDLPLEKSVCRPGSNS